MAGNSPSMVIRVAADLADLQQDFTELNATIATEGDAIQSGLTTTMISIGTFLGNLGAEAIAKVGEVVAAGARAIVTELGEILLAGAEVADVAGAFDRLTAAAGLFGQELLGSVAEGTHHTIENLELMKTLNRDLNAGMHLSTDQFRVMADGAYALAQATGGDVAESLETVNDAMLTGRTRALELAGVHVDLEAAEAGYAAALGKTAAQLTDDEKLYADRRAILEALATSTAALGEQTDGLEETIDQAKAAWANFRAELGRYLNDSNVIGAGLVALRDALVDAFGGDKEALIKAIGDAINKIAIWVVEAAIKVTEFAEVGARVFGLWQGPVDALSFAFVALVERVAAGLAKLAELAASVPGVGGAFEATAEAARHAAESWRAAKDEAYNTMVAHDAMAKGQGPVIDAIRTTRGVLEQMKTAMEGARQATEDTAATTQDHLIPTVRNLTTTFAELKPAIADLRPELEPMGATFFTAFTRAKAAVDEFRPSLETTSAAMAETGAEAIDMSQSVRFAAETVEEAAATVTRASVSWSEAMDLVRQGQGTMSGQISAPGAGLNFNNVGEWSKIAAERGGAVRFDDYGNPYVDFTGGFTGHTSPIGTGGYMTQADWERRIGTQRAIGTSYLGGGGASTVTQNVTVNTVMGDKHEIARVVKDALADDWRSTGQRA